MSFHKFTALFESISSHPIEPCDPEPPLSRATTNDDWANYPWLEEFFASAIDPELALANVVYLDGDAALEAFLEEVITQRQRVQSYLTTGNERLVQRYKFLEAGAWFATCTDSPTASPAPLAPTLKSQGK